MIQPRGFPRSASSTCHLHPAHSEPQIKSDSDSVHLESASMIPCFAVHQLDQELHVDRSRNSKMQDRDPVPTAYL